MPVLLSILYVCLVRRGVPRETLRERRERRLQDNKKKRERGEKLRDGTDASLSKRFTDERARTAYLVISDNCRACRWKEADRVPAARRAKRTIGCIRLRTSRELSFGALAPIIAHYDWFPRRFRARISEYVLKVDRGSMSTDDRCLSGSKQI